MMLVEKIKKLEMPKDWEKKSFDELFTISGGLSASREQLGKDGVCYLHYGDIHTSSKNYIDVEKEYEHIPKINMDEDNISASMLLNEGDVVFVDASEDYEGASKYIVIKSEGKTAFVAGLHTIVAKSKGEFLNNDFKRYCFETTSVKKQFYFYATGIKVYGLSKANIAKIEMVIPPLIDQEKISKILMICDRNIELKEELLIEKHKQKKWFVKNLLSPDTGIRLPGFDSEWEMVKLGSLGDTYSGLTGKSKDAFGKGKPYIPYLNIFANPIIDVSNFDYVEIAENENQNKVKYGDIFFTTSSETPEEVGMTSVLLDRIDELYLNSFCFGFRLHSFKILNPKFAAYYLRGKLFRTILNTLAQGATRFNLSKNNLMESEIIIPNVIEQAAIADVFSTLDFGIKLREKELENSKQQKKALMQMLLRGVVRIKV